MKVLLNQNVAKLGEIGEVIDVKPGFARNYLLPQGMATAPTEANIRKVEQRKQEYLEELARHREELETRARVLEGKQLTITARANEEGQLYGSVGGAQIAAALAEEGIFIEPEHVDLDEPIRQLDKYDVTIRFPQEITATIHVWVLPVGGSQGEAQPPQSAEQQDEARQSSASEEADEGAAEQS